MRTVKIIYPIPERYYNAFNIGYRAPGEKEFTIYPNPYRDFQSARDAAISMLVNTGQDVCVVKYSTLWTASAETQAAPDQG